AADVGVGAYVVRHAVGDHERLVGADLAGRPPGGFQEPPQLGGGPGRADDGGAAAAGPARTVREGAYGLGGGADRDEVGARVAQGREPAVLVPAPHLAAQPPRVQTGGLDP